MELAIVGILVSLSIRSMIGEWIISRIYSIDVIWNIVAEFVLSIAFIFCMYFNNGYFFSVFYLIVVILYTLIEKKEIISALKLLKKVY